MDPNTDKNILEIAIIKQQEMANKPFKKRN